MRRPAHRFTSRDNIGVMVDVYVGRCCEVFPRRQTAAALDTGYGNHCARLRVVQRVVMLFELDVDALKPFRSRTNTFTHLPEYPMTDYDISLLFDSQVKWSQMYDVIAQGIHENGLLHGADFVDEYRGKQVPAGKKSVTIRLTIGSLEKTLTSTEIEALAATSMGIKSVVCMPDGAPIMKVESTKRLGAELRTR